MTRFKAALLKAALPLAFVLAWAGVSAFSSSGTHAKGANVSDSFIIAAGEKEKRVPEGAWGGDGIRAEVTDTGARLEYDCARGSIDVPLKLDRRGRFDLRGTYTREHPGPIRTGRAPAQRPARYTGRVNGQVMTLTITLTDTEESLGTFTLTFGRETLLRKCR